MSTEYLTGLTRYRITWRGKVIMQVQICITVRHSYPSGERGTSYVWRDATAMDMQIIRAGGEVRL